MKQNAKCASGRILNTFSKMVFLVGIISLYPHGYGLEGQYYGFSLESTNELEYLQLTDLLHKLVSNIHSSLTLCPFQSNQYRKDINGCSCHKHC